MSQQASPAIDDRWLGQLAAEPRHPLLPVLQRADAMISLVVVLAFLPTLYAVANRTLTEAGARQGLISLQCLSAENMSEFIDPAATGAPPSLAYQPLLMSWLTAFSLRLFGVGHSAGHVASAYLCTTGLIVSAYLLARRLGDERLGLLTALLLAFNPHVLKLAQEPVSQSAAGLFALLAMAGTVAHWQKSKAYASVRLLFGGIALGLCLLAGGPVAIAVVAILLLHAAWWRLGGMRQPAAPATFEFAPTGRRTSVRSVLILAVTGFAVGGWRCLLMGSRYGADFWLTWLGNGSSLGESVAARAPAADWPMLLQWANALVLPLMALAVLGVVVLIREQWRPDDEIYRRHRGLILVWLGISAILWCWRGANDVEIGSVGEFWRIMLIIPLAISAAVGLLALIDRKVPFRAAVAIGGITLADLIFASTSGGASWRMDGLADYGTKGWGLVALALVLPTALALIPQSGESAESRRRRILTGLVAGFVLANCFWGGLAVRRSNYGDRELEDLRGGLTRLTGVTRWTLVTPTSTEAAASRPPAQLLYTLRRVWPDAEMLRVDSWAAVAAQISEQPPTTSPGSHLVVIWSPRGQPRPAVPAGLLKAAAPTFAYRGHELATYIPGEPPS